MITPSDILNVHNNCLVQADDTSSLSKHVDVSSKEAQSKKWGSHMYVDDLGFWILFSEAMPESKFDAAAFVSHLCRF